MFEFMKKTVNDQSKVQFHTIPPVYDKHSIILILGSFPSVKSREVNFYYGHPQNRFWKVISAICESEVPQTERDKIHLLLDNRIALWDVAASCKVKGSSDTSISDTVANDIGLILKSADIKKIFLNGTAAQKLYNKHFGDRISIETHLLPSTSPANAAYSFERLVNEWKIIMY